jgi:hypothetical protein
MDDKTQLRAGVALLLLGGVILFAPQLLALRYSSVLLVVAVLVLATGALLVGLSRRGRAV